MSLLNWGLRLVGGPPWHALERAAGDPRRAQEKFLLTLIHRARDTAFGADHGFDRIHTVDDYRQLVPLTDYERLRPYVDRLRAGESTALTAEAPHALALTSGTTGEPKFLPVTRELEQAGSRLTRAWLYRALVDHPAFLNGRLLAIVSPDVEGRTIEGMSYGSASGRLYRTNAWLIRRRYALPPAVLAIKDFDAKYYAMARLGVAQDVSFLGTPNPSTILRLVETADACKEDIIRDVRNGGLSSRFDIPSEVRDERLPATRPNLTRARELERMVAEHRALRPSEYWPHLQLIGCWKGGSVGVQLSKLEPWFSAELPVRDLGYLSTEAHVTVPFQDEGSAGLLAVGSNFYEFIREDEIDESMPTTLLCDELEQGATYYMVLTTSGGLYRYDINDIVRVTGFHGRTPLLEFVRKGRDMTSIGGEKLHIAQVVEAMRRAQEKSRLSAAHYRAVACAESNRYELLIECEGETPRREALAVFLRAADSELCALNVEYRQKRESRRLDPPVLHVMQAGWHDRQYRKRVAQGARDTQFKSALLTSDLSVDDLGEISLTVDL